MTSFRAPIVGPGPVVTETSPHPDAEGANARENVKASRSHGYPSIDLGLALVRAKRLWDLEGGNYAPLHCVLNAVGYSSKSNTGPLTLSALKRFGLVEERGVAFTRELRLTKLARSIILGHGEERRKWLREAALTPTIHREIWEYYEGELPSDATLRYRLLTERGFSASAADELVAQLRRTLEFAEIDRGVAARAEQAAAEAPAPPPALLPDAHTVTIQGPFPLTEWAWDQMMRELATMRSTLVDPDAAVASETAAQASGAPPGGGLPVVVIHLACAQEPPAPEPSGRNDGRPRWYSARSRSDPS